MKTTKEDIHCTFVSPVYIKEENVGALEYFKETIQCILDQTCEDWSIVLVDDNSQNKLLDEYITGLIESQKQTIVYHHNNPNLGPGMTRNVGIDLAYGLGSDIVLFQDCDDLSHPRRVEVTKEIFKNKDVDVLYSSFIPIDEKGDEIQPENLAPSMKAIFENNKIPPVGKDVWKTLIAEKLYVNLTSSTSVRMEYAKNIPFPKCSSEDTYTWMLYSAHGAVFEHSKEIPIRYRIPSNVKISSSREYIGQKFYKEMVEILTKAFTECSEYALENGTATMDEIKKLESSFYINMIFALKMEGMNNMAKSIFQDRIKRSDKRIFV